MAKDLYAILGVSKDATDAEIKEGVFAARRANFTPM